MDLWVVLKGIQLYNYIIDDIEGTQIEKDLNNKTQLKKT